MIVEELLSTFANQTMDKGGKSKCWSIPDALNLKPFAFNLEEALSVENYFRPNLLAITQQELKPGEVTLESRDKAVNTLKFLKFWYASSHSVYFAAVSYLDMFLSKMKVQEKYLKCVTASCFYLATQKEIPKIDANQVVKMSQSKCSASDMLRMAAIIKDKLKFDQMSENGNVTTVIDFLKLYLKIFHCFTRHFDKKLISKDFLQLEHILTYAEVVLADSSAAFHKSSTIALALIQLEIEKIMIMTIPNRSLTLLGEMLLAVLKELQLTSKIKISELKSCHLNVSNILKHYDNYGNSKHHQDLVWNFSTSTIQASYKHRDYELPLKTIKE